MAEKRTQMARHLFGSSRNHFKLCRPHHRYSHIGGIRPRRSQEMVHCGACIHFFPCSLYFLVHCTLNLYKNSSSIKLILTRAFLFGNWGADSKAASNRRKYLLWSHRRWTSSSSSSLVSLSKCWISLLLQSFLRSEISIFSFTKAGQNGWIIIQLYVMAVQHELVTIVQIISLPVSFLSLARASEVADEVFHYDDRRNDGLNMKNRLLHFATHLLLLSSRLFAAALVTASYNRGLWVFFIFAFPHSYTNMWFSLASWQRLWRWNTLEVIGLRILIPLATRWYIIENTWGVSTKQKQRRKENDAAF